MLSPKQIEKAMKKMGIKSEDLDVKEVIFRMKDKEIVVENPHVSKIDFGGNTTFQVVGDVKERTVFSEEDIKLIMDQTGCDRTDAENALKETGDIAAAILKIKGE